MFNQGFIDQPTAEMAPCRPDPEEELQRHRKQRDAIQVVIGNLDMIMDSHAYIDTTREMHEQIVAFYGAACLADRREQKFIVELLEEIDAAPAEG